MPGDSERADGDLCAARCCLLSLFLARLLGIQLTPSQLLRFHYDQCHKKSNRHAAIRNVSRRVVVHTIWILLPLPTNLTDRMSKSTKVNFLLNIWVCLLLVFPHSLNIHIPNGQNADSLARQKARSHESSRVSPWTRLNKATKRLITLRRGRCTATHNSYFLPSCCCCCCCCPFLSLPFCYFTPTHFFTMGESNRDSALWVLWARVAHFCLFSKHFSHTQYS